MKQEDAFGIVHDSIAGIALLRDADPDSAEFVKWKRSTRIALEKLFNKDSDQVREFEDVRYSPAVVVGRGFSRPSSSHSYLAGLDRAKALLESFIEEIQKYGAPSLSTPPLPSHSAIDTIELICDRFHLVTRQLQKRREDRATLRVKDEYDLQDLFHSLLRLFFDDIRPEEWTPSYAGSSAKMDFILKPQQIVIELKMTRSGLGRKELGNQLLLDIARYSQYADCKELCCFVYDPDARIDNPRGMESDLESQSNAALKLHVFIRPCA
jgi:hypothetical protein